jgi:hypothetical protein
MFCPRNAPRPHSAEKCPLPPQWKSQPRNAPSKGRLTHEASPPQQGVQLTERSLTKCHQLPFRRYYTVSHHMTRAQGLLINENLYFTWSHRSQPWSMWRILVSRTCSQSWRMLYATKCGWKLKKIIGFNQSCGSESAFFCEAGSGSAVKYQKSGALEAQNGAMESRGRSHVGMWSQICTTLIRIRIQKWCKSETLV